MRKIIFLISWITPLAILAQIKSGPMLGHKELKEVSIWVQTVSDQEVVFEYFAENEETNKTKIVKSTIADNANTLTLIAKNLEPGTTYNYSITIAENEAWNYKGKFSTQELWNYRMDPPAFTFALGSCAYINEAKYDRPGEPYGRGYEIFESIVASSPDLMLWLGDNIYLREADWGTKSGVYHRYTHFRSLPELQNLWQNTHHYAIWDDHDYGPNDADRSFINKSITYQAFQDFWTNPSYGVHGQEGISSQFTYNDVDFFLLDNRYFRSPNNRKSGKRQIVGDEQIEWLIDALISSSANFKVVAIGGQLLSPAAVYENHATFPEERNKIIQLIQQENIKNVIFLSGDRHKTELTKMELDNGNVIYDYTCSPLTSKAYDTSDEGNNLRVEGTHVSTQNFGLIHVKGSFKERFLVLKCLDKTGKLLWEKEIKKQL